MKIVIPQMVFICWISGPNHHLWAKLIPKLNVFCKHYEGKEDRKEVESIITDLFS